MHSISNHIGTDIFLNVWHWQLVVLMTESEQHSQQVLAACYEESVSVDKESGDTQQ